MTRTATAAVSLFDLDPDTYVPHELHAGDRSYPETNCYTDILIELVHAAGHEPLAMMGSSAAIDFEGDQWTFFKPQPDEIELLYGIDVHEMQPYRPLPDQIAEQIEQRRTLIVELDSFYLPDTAGTSYRKMHVKSSAVMEAIDREGERLHYFHNGSLHSLRGDDYRNVFRLDREFSPDVLPPYTELVRFDRGPALGGKDVLEAAQALLARHLSRRPVTNPFLRYGEALERDLPRLLDGDDAEYHDYAFATVRMAGAAFEVCSSHVQWLHRDRAGDARRALLSIVDSCKILSFKLARRRPFDPTAQIADLVASWDRAQSLLDDLAD
ncbi:MAG TPA: DUF1839 family protein [Gaiellaceae bacterium]